MNFYEQQARSRSRTGLLILLFTLGLLGLFVFIYITVFVFCIAFFGRDFLLPDAPFQWSLLWNPALVIAVAIFVLLLVGYQAIQRAMLLVRGGSHIAQILGGRLVNTETNDLLERRLVNVVEEMAIASGTPVPAIYVLSSEFAINAFAAGFSADDAVIGVTRGALTHLKRDELQGVIAHEFSHILNGDMRLNIRLISLLAGIMGISVLGAKILHATVEGRPDRGVISLLFLGLSLTILGYAGALVGRVIQSAINRQREYLADACAVQFTRNPAGISGALRKIGGRKGGSLIYSPQALEMGHLFFGHGIGDFADRLFATHPPLAMRIRKISPGFDGTFDTTEDSGLAEIQSADTDADKSSPGPGTATAASPSAAQVRDRVGNPDSAHLTYVRHLLAALPAELRQEIASSLGACTVVYALLLDADPDARRHQMEVLRGEVSGEFADTVNRLAARIDGLAREYRLCLLDLALPALRQLSPGQYRMLLRLMDALVEADRQVTAFEFCVRHIIRLRLHHVYEKPVARETLRSLKKAAGPLAELTMILAHSGAESPEEARNAYTHAMQALPPSLAATLSPDYRGDLRRLQIVLDSLSHASPEIRGKALELCTRCVFSDRQVTTEEKELVRAVAYSLALPLPPFLPGAPGESG